MRVLGFRGFNGNGREGGVRMVDPAATSSKHALGPTPA